MVGDRMGSSPSIYIPKVSGHMDMIGNKWERAWEGEGATPHYVSHETPYEETTNLVFV